MKGTLLMSGNLWLPVAELMLDLGIVWPEVLARMDWVCWQLLREEGLAELPTKPALAERWRWTQYRVGQFLKTQDRPKLPARGFVVEGPKLDPLEVASTDLAGLWSGVARALAHGEGAGEGAQEVMSSSLQVAPDPSGQAGQEAADTGIGPQEKEPGGAPGGLKGGSERLERGSSGSHVGLEPLSQGPVGQSLRNDWPSTAGLEGASQGSRGALIGDSPAVGLTDQALNLAIHNVPVYDALPIEKYSTIFQSVKDEKSNWQNTVVDTSGTEPAISSSLSSKISREQPSRSLEKKEGMPADLESSQLPSVNLLLRLLKRWSGEEAPKGRSWLVRAREDVDWFLMEISTMAEAARVDLVDVLKRWDEWLERMARSSAAKDHKLFPRNWKSSLRKQIQLRAAWEEKQRERREHVGAATLGQAGLGGPARGAEAEHPAGPGPSAGQTRPDPDDESIPFAVRFAGSIRRIRNMDDLRARDEARAREAAERERLRAEYASRSAGNAGAAGGRAVSGGVWGADPLRAPDDGWGLGV